MAALLSIIKRKLASTLPFHTTAHDVVDDAADERPLKRPRHDDARGDGYAIITPHLLSETTSLLLPSPSFKLDLSKDLFNNGNKESGHPSSPNILYLLPKHIISRCTSFIATRQDRFALQVTCKTLQELSNKSEMLVNITLCGKNEAVDSIYAEEGEDNQGVENDNNEDTIELRRKLCELSPLTAPKHKPLGGILLDTDSSITACKKLMKFSIAGNKEAIYMLGLISCYCFENISEGLALLRYAADSLEHIQSIMALALILRDNKSVEADYYLSWAASLNYLPAWQEKLTATEMRAKYGDLDAELLSKYLDPPCLNKLLGRHYLECQRTRKNHQTSHCWNPICGRWAYKASSPREQARVANIRASIIAHYQGTDQRWMNGFLQRFDEYHGLNQSLTCQQEVFSIESLLPKMIDDSKCDNTNESSLEPTSLEQLREALRKKQIPREELKVSRMKMCSSCRRAKYCSKLCQVYDWRSGRHKIECQHLNV